MRSKLFFVFICLVAGCQSLRSKPEAQTNDIETSGVAHVVAQTPAEPPPKPKPMAPDSDVPKKAEEEKPKAVAAKPVSIAKPTETAGVDHLMLAAECMERSDSLQAADHLRDHLLKHPEQIMIRAYLGDLLYKIKRIDESKWQFERFVVEAQDAGGASQSHLLHCHTRLMELAELREDDYAEHLHRGIGLYLLGCKNALEARDKDDDFREQFFLKATAELKIAQKIEPEDARPSWYLYLCWNRLNQIEPARTACKQACERVHVSTMTPKEKRDLQLLQVMQNR